MPGLTNGYNIHWTSKTYPYLIMAISFNLGNKSHGNHLKSTIALKGWLCREAKTNINDIDQQDEIVTSAATSILFSKLLISSL